MTIPSILVIDDEPDNFDVIETIFSDQNYELHYSASGKEALSFLETLAPDLILLDVMMPEMDGIEVCQRIKDQPKYHHIPIMMVTALTSRQDLANCLNTGADDFISKPVNAIELRARTQSLLRIKSQYDELKNLLKLREDMSNMIVHDLRNPLSSIILAAEIIQKYGVCFDAKPIFLKKADQILSAGKQLKNMIDGLLLMAKLESGKILFNPVPTDLYELGAVVVRDFQAIADSREIELQSELPHRDQNIFIDGTILRRVIDNLMSNALKFSNPGDRVTLSLEYLPDNHLRVKVADTGAGITEEEKQTIFGKFEIGNLKKNTAQTGLGLAFCKMAIEAQNGTLAIADNHPQGSIFVVEI